MSRAPITITCRHCGAEMDLIDARLDEQWRELIGVITSMPAALHEPCWRYLALFGGRGRPLTSARLLRLARQLKEAVERGTVRGPGGIRHEVTAAEWAAAMRHLVDAPPATMRLPLTGHGYLAGVLANRAEQRAAKAEQAAIERARNRPATPASGGGAPASVGAILGAVQDPAPARRSTLSREAQLAHVAALKEAVRRRGGGDG